MTSKTDGAMPRRAQLLRHWGRPDIHDARRDSIAAGRVCRRSTDDDGGAAFTCFCGTTTAGTRAGRVLLRSDRFAHLPSPCEDLLRRQPVSTRRFEDDGAGPGERLKSTRRPLRLRREVKSRRKPISDPNAGSAASQIKLVPERWP